MQIYCNYINANRKGSKFIPDQIEMETPLREFVIKDCIDLYAHHKKQL